MIEKDADVEILFDDLDETDLGSLLKTYNEINLIKKAIEEKTEILKTKVKIFLKEKKWTQFKDEASKISVTITTQQRESVNKKTLKMILNDEQYNKVVTKTSFEKMLIITPKDRARLNKYGKK